MSKKQAIKIIVIVILVVFFAAFFYFSFKDNFGPYQSPALNSNDEHAEFPLSEPTKIATTSIVSSIRPPVFPERKCLVENYGAKTNDNFLNSPAINQAISDCSSKGGGKVVIPPGKWLSGAIKLRSNIDLQLEQGAELVFSTDKNLYLPPVLSRFQGMELYNYAPPIYAIDAENIAITGKGKIVGNGEPWWRWAQNTKSRQSREDLFEMSKNNIPVEKRQFAREENGLRPSFIVTINCKNILFDGIRIEDGPMWTVHFVYSKNITVRNINVDTYSSNTDGIVVDSSTNVLIENSHLAAGDDAIAIKSGLEDEGLRVNRPSENIVIRNNRITKAHGAVAIGSEMSGGVRNVYIHNSEFITTDNGLRIKTTDSRGGFVENISMENIKMENIENDAIVIDLSYGSKLSSKADRVPSVKNINIQNIDIRNALRTAKIDGIIDGPMEDIRLKNIRAKTKGGIYLNEASNVFFENISLQNTDPAHYFEIRDSRNVTVRKFSCPKDGNLCFKIKGKQTENINLKETSFDTSRMDMEKRLVGRIILD